MKKRILAPTIAAVMADPLTTCSGLSGTGTKATPAETEAPASGNKSETKEESRAGEGDAANTAPSKGGSEGYELALVTDLGIIGDKFSSQGVWEELKKYIEENGIFCKYYQLQKDTAGFYLETIGLTIEGGTKLMVHPGFLFEEPIYLARDKYPGVHFILLDGEPHDADYNCKTNDNIMPIPFQEGQADFPAGYVVVKDGYTKLEFMRGVAMPAVIRFGCGFVQGTEFAAGEDGITGLEIIYNYTSAFSATSETQPMTASWCQNGTEVIFGCGGAVGNSIMAAAQEKSTEVIDMDVDQSVESETVITFAMELLSNSVYDGVKDFYDDSFLGGRTSVFTAANNGAGLPMNTSKFEKFSQEQYDTVYKKLTDGEIGLVQFSADNSDPAGDLTNLTNTEVTFVGQGLAAVWTVQGPEMTYGR